MNTINTAKMTKAQLLELVAQLQANNEATVEGDVEKTPAQLMCDEVAGLCSNYNVMLGNETPVAELNELKLTIEGKLDEANAELKKEEFNKFLLADEPMKAAIGKGVIPQISLKANKDTRELSTSDKVEIIDLADLDIHAGKSVAIDPMWGIYVEALNHSIINYSCDGVGVEVRKSGLKKFKQSSASSVLGISEEIFDSKDALITALQTVCDKIATGMKITKEHAFTFERTFMGWGRELTTVSMMTEQKFRRSMLRLMHWALTGTKMVADK